MTTAGNRKGPIPRVVSAGALAIYVLAAFAAAIAALVYTFGRVSERTRTEPFVTDRGTFEHASLGGGASEWLRAGIRSLGEVPSMRIPASGLGADVSPGEVDVALVDVEQSMVWRDTLAPERDGLFVDNYDDSIADLVVNTRHPYAKYFTDFDNLLLELASAGRKYASESFAGASPTALEAVAFRSVRTVSEGDREYKVYTLDPGFANDHRASRAMYDILFAVSTLRACFIHGEAVDAILAALKDHAETARRNALALARIRERARVDFDEAGTILANDFANETTRMSDEAADAAGRITDLKRARDAMRERGSVARSRRDATLGTLGAQRTSLASTKSKLARTEAALDDTAVSRGAVSVDLESVRSRSAAVSGARGADEAALLAQTRATKLDMARGLAGAARADREFVAASRDSSHARTRLDAIRARRADTAARLETAENALVSAHRDSERLQKNIATARRRGQELGERHAAVVAEKARTLRVARDAKRRMAGRLDAAMDANNEAQSSYALWDKYASLSRLADELDAHDNGLPSRN